MKSNKLILFIVSTLFLLQIPAYSAEQLILYKGIFSRTILIKDLKDFSKTKRAKGTIKNIIKLTNQNEVDVANILNEEIELPLMLTSKLIHSKIGTAIIKKAGEIVYPNRHKDEKISSPAIRSAVIKAIVDGDEKINLINFLEAYPNKSIAINVTALNKTVSKVESMSELVQFFSDSPIKKLKEGRSES